MPYNRPGLMKYRTATKAVNHGAPCIELGAVGVAVKQKAPGSGSGSGTPQKQIAISERFAIITKGIVQVPIGALTVVDGTPIYIVSATNALDTTSNSGANPKFGVVAELPADGRGVPTGFMRVDLDGKDQFV